MGGGGEMGERSRGGEVGGGKEIFSGKPLRLVYTILKQKHKELVVN